MSKAMKLTLIAIAAFFLAVAGSFVWFVATWDKEAEQPIGRVAPQHEERQA